MDDRTTFLDALHRLGGKAGNGALRAALAWTPERYTLAKIELLRDSYIIPGTGRGGSVRLNPGGTPRKETLHHV